MAKTTPLEPRLAASTVRRVLRSSALALGGLLLVACSSTSTNGASGASPDGGPTGGGSGGPPQTVKAAEAEPNNDAAGAQDLGSAADSTTFVVTGELASGGNDGTSYTGDWDVFALTLGAAGKLDVSVDWQGAADVDVAIFDGSQKQLAADGATSKPASASVGSVSGKVIVGLFSKDQSAAYTLTITYTKAGSGGGGGGGGGGGTCPTTPVEPAAPASGCEITLSTAVCSTADLTGGKSFELAWSTNTTFCEGPHKLQIGGDPPSSWSGGNAVEISVSSQPPDARAGMTRNIGGYFNINAQDIAGLTSSSGVYYYRVLSFYGSASEVRAFKVVK